MKLQCRNCGQEIPAQDINIQAAIAKCQHCHAVFAFGAELGASRGGSGSTAKRHVEMPNRFELDQSGANLLLIYRWLSSKTFILLFFCIFWDGFLVFWYWSAFTTNAPLFAKIFPVLHVAVGVGLTYFVIASFLNSTTLEVGYAEVSVHHGPLPWSGNRVVPRAEIEQLFC